MYIKLPSNAKRKNGQCVDCVGTDVVFQHVLLTNLTRKVPYFVNSRQRHLRRETHFPQLSICSFIVLAVRTDCRFPQWNNKSGQIRCIHWSSSQKKKVGVLGVPELSIVSHCDDGAGFSTPVPRRGTPLQRITIAMETMFLNPSFL